MYKRQEWNLRTFSRAAEVGEGKGNKEMKAESDNGKGKVNGMGGGWGGEDRSVPVLLFMLERY